MRALNGFNDEDLGDYELIQKMEEQGGTFLPRLVVTIINDVVTWRDMS